MKGQFEVKHKNAFYTVKRLRLLEYLMNLGFEPYKTIPDADNPKYKWWLFENSAELEGAINAYFGK
jgi:hypothetical protein